jgi:hypothetical protein
MKHIKNYKMFESLGLLDTFQDLRDMGYDVEVDNQISDYSMIIITHNKPFQLFQIMRQIESNWNLLSNKYNINIFVGGNNIYSSSYFNDIKELPKNSIVSKVILKYLPKKKAA